MTRLAAVVTCVVMLVPSFVHGQARPYKISDGFLDRVAFPSASISSECATPLIPTAPEYTKSLQCSVVNVSIIDTSGGVQWGLARYRRLAVDSYEDFTDTLDFDELVLFEQHPSADSVALLWHVIRARQYEFITDADWTRRDKNFLLRITLCLNGTGGCSEAFLLRSPSGWSVVEMAFLDEMKKYFPEGYRIHKGRRLDLRTLSGVQPIAAPGDGNCCPSGLVEFSLDLVGSTLHLRSAKVIKPKQE